VIFKDFQSLAWRLLVRQAATSTNSRSVMTTTFVLNGQSVEVAVPDGALVTAALQA
jgi:hypothetical protein